MAGENVGHEIAAKEGQRQENGIGPVKGAKDYCEKQGRDTAVVDQENEPVVKKGLHAELLEEAPSEVASQAMKSSRVKWGHLEGSEQRPGDDLGAKEEKGREENGLGGRPKHEVSHAQGRT